MREITFRGKRVDNGEWVEGSLTVNHYDRAGKLEDEYRIVEICYVLDEDDLPMYQCGLDEAVVPSTVGQYTGLTDKNGKKIFEGDIIEFTDDVYKRTDKGICVFKDGSYQIKFNYYKSHIAYHRIGQVDVDRDMGASYTICYEYNVIGNIYDNNEMENAE